MTETPEKGPQMFVCPKCGGQDLSAPADAYWCVENQEFLLGDLNGGDDYCLDCQDPVRGEFAPADLKTLAKLAISKSNKGDTHDHPNTTGTDPRQLDFGF